MRQQLQQAACAWPGLRGRQRADAPCAPHLVQAVKGLPLFVGPPAIAKGFCRCLLMLLRQAGWPARAVGIKQKALARLAGAVPLPPAVHKGPYILVQAMVGAVLFEYRDGSLHLALRGQHSCHGAQAYIQRRPCHPACRAPLGLPFGVWLMLCAEGMIAQTAVRISWCLGGIDLDRVEGVAGALALQYMRYG